MSKPASKACGDAAEAGEVANAESAILGTAATRGNMTKFESEQAISVVDYLESTCSEDTMNLDFFVDKMVADEHLHLNSSFLIQALAAPIHKMAHKLEYHAKAALILHNESNGLAHHFVAHLKHQDRSRKAAAEGAPLDKDPHLKTAVHEMLHQAARSELTDKQREHLHKLDEKHHEVMFGESKKSTCSNHAKRQQEIPADSPLNDPAFQEYVNCECLRNEPSLVCRAKHDEALHKVAKKLADGLADARKASDMKVMAAQAMSDPLEDVQTALAGEVVRSNASRVAFGPCKKAVSCSACVSGICIPFPGYDKKDSFNG